MKTAGIICEYNPFHTGHYNHIEMTGKALGEDTYIVCVMSGNFVQRGDFAVFNKHSRAKAAVLGGADVVIELPVPYALGSAREFAKAGVYLLDATGVCDYISFGSESGNINLLQDAARIIATDKAQKLIREYLGKGLPYATAQQKAADAVLGDHSSVFCSPNNILAIEYLKALEIYNSKMLPLTVQRSGGEHDGDTGFSASAIRRQLVEGILPADCMPDVSVKLCKEEISQGKGPVFMKDMEPALMSRLRLISDVCDVPGATDGLGERFIRAANKAPAVQVLLEEVKTKRFAMSRIRRLLMCAVLGITNKHIAAPPPYIRILAMNERGIAIMKAARKKANLPVITKPSSVLKMGKRAVNIFNTECAATDFYTLAYKNQDARTGGSEWRTSPVVIG